jgi:hypothetical protein
MERKCEPRGSRWSLLRSRDHVFSLEAGSGLQYTPTKLYSTTVKKSAGTGTVRQCTSVLVVLVPSYPPAAHHAPIVAGAVTTDDVINHCIRCGPAERSPINAVALGSRFTVTLPTPGSCRLLDAHVLPRPASGFRWAQRGAHEPWRAAAAACVASPRKRTAGWPEGSVRSDQTLSGSDDGRRTRPILQFRRSVSPGQGSWARSFE